MLIDLSDQARERVGPALGACPALELRAGEAAIPAELSEAVLLVVERGVVLLASGARDAARRMIEAVAGPGAVLVPPTPGAELRALLRAQLTALTPDAESALLREPDAARAITTALVAAVRDREESLANLARFPHAERVRGKLLQLGREHGKVSYDGVLIDLPLTHDLIAESVGSTRETVTLALRELEQTGFLSRVDRRYRVNVSPEELAARLPRSH